MDAYCKPTDIESYPFYRSSASNHCNLKSPFFFAQIVFKYLNIIPKIEETIKTKKKPMYISPLKFTNREANPKSIIFSGGNFSKNRMSSNENILPFITTYYPWKCSEGM